MIQYSVIALRGPLYRWQGAMAGKPYTMTELRSCFCMGDGIRPAKLSVDASGNLVSGM